MGLMGEIGYLSEQKKKMALLTSSNLFCGVASSSSAGKPRGLRLLKKQ
jgi:hypothetical protein